MRWLTSRNRKLKHGDRATRSADANHFTESALRVGDVSQTEGDSDKLKRVVGEGEGLRIGFDETELL